MAKRTSHDIGRELEARVSALLEQWGIIYEAKRHLTTKFGSGLELDFWLPARGERPDVVLECKNFGVAAKSPADSRRRKAQEAFYLLAQVRRHVPGLETARLVVVTGREHFERHQLEFLRAELGPDFHVASVSDVEGLRRVLTAPPERVET